MKAKVLVTVSIFAFLALMSAYAQPQSITAKIDFPFMVGSKTLPAGSYEFIKETQNQAIRVQGEGMTALAMAVTRLAGEMHTTPQDAHLVFDVVDGTNMLSEVWIPGEDGYMLLATKGKHTHKVLNVK
jgi:hypothetical protein